MNPREESELMVLRLALYGKMQQFKGEALREFWKLIDEIAGLKSLHKPEEEAPVDALRNL